MSNLGGPLAGADGAGGHVGRQCDGIEEEHELSGQCVCRGVSGSYVGVVGTFYGPSQAFMND